MERLLEIRLSDISIWYFIIGICYFISIWKSRTVYQEEKANFLKVHRNRKFDEALEIARSNAIGVALFYLIGGPLTVLWLLIGKVLAVLRVLLLWFWGDKDE